MLEPRDFFRDWGPWGWLWGLGLVAFLLGLFLVPLALAGQVPAVLLFTSTPGAVLMWGSARGAIDAVV